ncbi:MAG: DUF2279 domain-containing protein [Salibacteraceae bacterium]
MDAEAQVDSLPRAKTAGWVNPALLVTEGVVSTGSLIALQTLWYSDYPRQSFAFFDDWRGWQQMDKAGHASTAYQCTDNLYRIHLWAGWTPKQARWWAAGLTWTYMLGFEIMDGFSAGWGFSPYDLTFNTLGAALWMGQHLAWNDQRIKLKFSFFPSGLTQPNQAGFNTPEMARAQSLFGNSIAEQWIKDYNGQTYWLSVNIWSLMGKPNGFPRWINAAIGYSSNNLLGAERNEWIIGRGGEMKQYRSSLERERQFIASLDIDLYRAKLPRAFGWLKPVFGIIKLPFPAIEWNNKRGLVFHAVYF